MGDAGGGGQVVLGGGGGGYLLIFESVQEVLTAVLLVAVFHNGAQSLRPRHLEIQEDHLLKGVIVRDELQNDS